jgi:catechol 2,3-dioxygenase-like lactoylglutathione lyase family enzyme
MAVIENVTPILRVRDVEASRRYYVDTLGFRLEWDARRPTNGIFRT